MTRWSFSSKTGEASSVLYPVERRCIRCRTRRRYGYIKERFREHGISRKAFRKFNHQIEKANLMAKSGKIVDASFVEVPRQRNTREVNRYIKEE
ncbi:MAG TPA: hypothetical protein VLM75_05525 [Spirochaetota bacterium]|nr:hypothetical protein [Spirochaetota bacterium]